MSQAYRIDSILDTALSMIVVSPPYPVSLHMLEGSLAKVRARKEAR